MSAVSRALLLAALVCSLGCGSTLRARGVQPARSTMDELRSSVQPRRVALVVGIDSYDDPAIPALRFAQSDAEAVAEHLLRAEARGGAGFDRVRLMAGQDSTRGAVLAEARSLAADLRRQDVFVLYFSGHGLATLNEEVPSLYLLARDTERDDLAISGMDLAALRAWFGGLPAQRKALIVDACFSGGGKSARGIEAPERIEEALAAGDGPDPAALGSGEAHLFATTLGRPAFEDDALGRGVYTHFLLGALDWGRETADRDGDGVVTAWEAHDFARARAMEHTDGAQVPEATLRVVGLNDVVLAGDPLARKSRDEALVYDYGAGGKLFAGATLYVDGRARGVFPGTMDVPEGEHRIEVRDPAGETLFAGDTVLRGDQRFSLPDLRIRLRKDRVLQSVRVAMLGSPSPAFRELWGLGAVGAELEGGLRVADGPARGLVFLGVLGVAGPLTKPGERVRPVLTGGLGLGWGADVGRIRLRGSWQLRALGLTRLAPEGLDPLGKDGFLLFGTGPAMHVGLLLDGHAALMLSMAGQGAVVDLSGAGEPSLAVWGTASLGVELAF